MPFGATRARSGGMNQPATPDSHPEEVSVLRKENAELREVNRLLKLKVEKLERQLWSPKSERTRGEDQAQGRLFAEPEAVLAPAAGTPAKAGKGGGSRIAKGPKPLDPALRREVIRLPDPDLKDLICPESGRARQPAFVEWIEVLARRPAEYYVKVYERMVFTSEMKTAPVYAPWPVDVLPRSRTHASVVAHIACAHFADHLPYHRIEQQLARVGVDLPRVCQVSLMRQLDERTNPLVRHIKEKEVLGSGYVQLDATPIPVADPDRPGRLQEATLWAYRSLAGPVWFEYRATKSPKGPNQVLVDTHYRGYLQTDGAPGLGEIGPTGEVISLGCHAHLRRPIYQAVKGGEKKAQRYLEAINRLFRIERLAKRFKLSVEKRQQLRGKHSVPLFQALVAWAKEEVITATPKTEFSDGLHYLLGQEARLERCLRVPQAELSNNGAENSIRPLKLGSKNWIGIGHPNAGPRLANLFTLVENCRQAGIDPEAYLIDVIARLPDHPAKDIGTLSPWKWKPPAGPPAATTASSESSPGPGR